MFYAVALAFLASCAAASAPTFTNFTLPNTARVFNFMYASPYANFGTVCGGGSSDRSVIFDTAAMRPTGVMPSMRAITPNHVCYHELGPAFVYVSSCTDGLMAFDRNGTVVFKSAPVAGMNCAWGPAYADGRVYVATQGGTLVAMDAATGALLWSLPNIQVASRGLIHKGYALFVSSGSGVVIVNLATKATAQVSGIQPRQSGSMFDAAPMTTFSFEPVAYVFTNDHRFVALSLASGKVKFSQQMGRVPFAASVNDVSFVETPFNLFVYNGSSVAMVRSNDGSNVALSPMGTDQAGGLSALSTEVYSRGTSHVVVFDELTDREENKFAIPNSATIKGSGRTFHQRGFVMLVGNMILKVTP